MWTVGRWANTSDREESLFPRPRPPCADHPEHSLLPQSHGTWLKSAGLCPQREGLWDESHTNTKCILDTGEDKGTRLERCLHQHFFLMTIVLELRQCPGTYCYKKCNTLFFPLFSKQLRFFCYIQIIDFRFSEIWSPLLAKTPADSHLLSYVLKSAGKQKLLPIKTALENSY